MRILKNNIAISEELKNLTSKIVKQESNITIELIGQDIFASVNVYVEGEFGNESHNVKINANKFYSLEEISYQNTEEYLNDTDNFKY